MNENKINNENQANNDTDGAEGDRSQSDEERIEKRKKIRRKSIYEKNEVSSNESDSSIKRKSVLLKTPIKKLVAEAILLNKPIESSQESETDANQGDSSDNNDTPAIPIYPRTRKNSIASIKDINSKIDKEESLPQPKLKKQISKLPKKKVRKHESTVEQSAFDLIPGILLILFWSQIFIIIFYHYNIFIIPQI